MSMFDKFKRSNAPRRNRGESSREVRSSWSLGKSPAEKEEGSVRRKLREIFYPIAPYGAEKGGLLGCSREGVAQSALVHFPVAPVTLMVVNK